MFDASDNSSTSGFVSSSEYVVSGQFSEFIELSSRGYCRLFKAQRNGQWFVLKALKLECQQNLAYQGMLEKEFNLMMQLNHPNVVRVYSREEIPDFGPCIVMEYVDGRTLDDFIKGNPTQSVRESVAQQLLEAIGYCHGKQIIHRDLKPSNVLVTYNGNRVKLIDFGLSDSDRYAVLKEPAYTKAYAAPEQLAGEEVDNRTDLYAFGLILKQLFPNQYGHVVRKCLQPRREKRYASAEEVMMAMRRIMRIRKSIPLWCVLFLTIIAISVISAMNWRQHNRQMRSTTEQTTASSDTISPESSSPHDDSKTISIQSPTKHSENIDNEPVGQHSFANADNQLPTREFRDRYIDSLMNAQQKEEEQESLDNVIYNFKFTIDSMFKPVDLYVKSDEVKTSNILCDLIYIAEYKAKIRECQIRRQLPKSKRSSFFNYATDQIGAKKKSYTQKYPPIPQYPNEQQVREPEIYQPILEQSKKYREEGRRLYKEWKRQMSSIQ